MKKKLKKKIALSKETLRNLGDHDTIVALGGATISCVIGPNPGHHHPKYGAGGIKPQCPTSCISGNVYCWSCGGD